MNPDLAKLASDAKVGRPSPRMSRVVEVARPEAARPSTPTRSKRLSEMSEAEPPRPATPTRKSRRLSGSIPEFLDSPAAAASVVLPLKKRRLSAVEPAAVPETVAEEEIDENEKISENSVAEKEDSTVIDAASLDVIMEEEEADKNTSFVAVETAPEAAAEPSKDAVEQKDAELQQLHADIDNEAAAVKKVQKPTKNPDSKLLAALPALLNLNKIARQKPKSGKFWKDERKQFRSLRKDKGLRRTFEERVKVKEVKARNKEMADLLMQAKISKRQDQRRRMEENTKAKEARQLKNEVFQIVKNPNKIKKIKKRDLAKRDILLKV